MAEDDDLELESVLASLSESSKKLSLKEAKKAEYMERLLVRALEAVARPQLAPQVTVNADVAKPQVDVILQPPVVEKVQQWFFDFERNKDGTVKRIVASAQN
jgi:hypothetical protein